MLPEVPPEEAKAAPEPEPEESQQASLGPWLGDRIYKLRQLRGWSQRDVAAKMDVPRSWISKLENYRAAPKASSLFRLAAVFEAPVGALVEPDETMAFAWVAVKGLSRRDRADLLAWLKSRTPKVTT